MYSSDLNDLISSHDPESILKFYSNFRDQEELVKWMRERPKGKRSLYEVEGSKDVVVVIPTKSHDSIHAKNCTDNIFKGMHIVFVESGDDNKHFNYASNCNFGMRKALEYEPKWIVLSNDDMIKIDGPKILTSSLASLDADRYSAVFTTTSRYHSYPLFLGYPNPVRHLYFTFSGAENRVQAKLEKKFGVDVVVHNYGSLQKKFFRKYVEIVNIGAFGIFSSKFVRGRGGELFDEVYLNEFEEVDLSYEISRISDRVATIDYHIGDLIGTGLGRSTVRKYRAVASRAYFNYKIKTGLLKFQPQS